MTGKSRRSERVEKELRQIISTYITNMQSGTSSDLISVTKVVSSPDLRNAKVYLSALGKDEVSEELVELVQSHAHDIQKIIGSHLRMKFCPRLKFENDKTIPFLARMDAVLKKDRES